MKRFNIDVKLAEGDDTELIYQEIDQNTRSVYIETISNLKLNVPDIRKIADVYHRHGKQPIVDNTFGIGSHLAHPITLDAQLWGVQRPSGLVT